jgi:putative tricarboxylic transport membrane protein
MRIDRIILVCTLIIAVAYMYGATFIPTLEIGDPLGPKAFPWLLGVALLISAGMLAFEMWRNVAKNRPQTDPAPFELGVIVVLAAVSVWTGLYYLVFVPLGFIVATAIYLLPLMAYFHPRKWITNTVTSILFSIGTYWLFLKLEVALPKGILPI